MDIETVREVFTLIAFVGTVTTTFALFASVLLRIAIALVTKKRVPTISRNEIVILALGAVGSLCVLYGFFVEPYWLSVEHVKLSSTKLAKGQFVRLVQISDLHCDPEKRLEDKLPLAISAEKPDAILFTGDAINSAAGLQNFRQCLTRLASIAPTFVVKGNWDAWYFKDSDRFGGTGAVELDSKAVPLIVRGSKILIAGLPVGTKQSVRETVANTSPDLYRIFLYHYPDYIEEMARNNIDLYLAGHTHGGQVALPFYGALVTLAATGKKYESGLHQLGTTYIYTNRGIGMEGGRAPRVRFCARPEVTVFDIVGMGIK
ncbi:MAG: metallophosphoesterase [Cyanobacteria bacterium SZAS LIN-5]|nr:metallophosphoesterase [Cyanobacteria bacterium SZAS LIN-5]